jgi:hypothetical protein
VRDTVVDGAQFHFGVGGGTGYFGFSSAFDCLMDNVQTSKLRHAPNLQFGAQGCVIRNSTFEDSDLQFHRDPTWDNLIENCTVRSRGSNKELWFLRLGHDGHDLAARCSARARAT